MLNIKGFGDNLTVNNIRIGDLSPNEHEKIELEKGGNNYKPLENVVVSHVQDSSTLICRKPSENGVKSYIEEELIDGLCCYSAVNQGQLNQTIVNAVVKHLTEEKLPTVPRSIRHKYMSAFLLAATGITEMDRVVPKVAGVEAPELMFKLSRRWGYEVKDVPQNDAIIVAAQIIQFLQTIVSRNTNPLESTVVTVGKINGGYNFNVIADKVTLEGTTRAYTEQNRQLIKTRMNELLDGIGSAFNAKITLNYVDGYPPVINNNDCAQKLLNAATKVVGSAARDPYLSMGGEDFSYFANAIPGCFFFIGSSPKDREPLSTPHHCSHFDIDEEALLVGANTFVQLIEDLLIK